MRQMPLPRLLIVLVLVALTLRWTYWLLTPWEHPDATIGRYALVSLSALICGLTALATTFVSERTDRMLGRIARH
jgi:hypothetical protein